MFDIIFRYIFKRLIISLFFITPIITLVVWLTLSIRYIDFIINDNIEIGLFLRLIISVLPDIVSVVLPICALISSINVFYRMQSEKEIIVMSTSGKSLLSLSSPLIIFSICISLFLLHFQTVIIPHSYRNLIDIQQRIQSKISMSSIKPGIFNVVGNSVVFIGSKKQDTLNDVFISYIPENNIRHQTNIISAKSGRYIIENDRLYITLKDGYRQLINSNNIAESTLKFESFSYDVTDFIKKYVKKTTKPHEKTQCELFDLARKSRDNEDLRISYLVEAHSRYIMTFLPLINSLLIIIFIVGSYSRTQKGRNSIKCMACGIIFEILTITLINISRKSEILIYINYVIMLSIIISLIYIAFLRNKT